MMQKSILLFVSLSLFLVGCKHRRCEHLSYQKENSTTESVIYLSDHIASVAITSSDGAGVKQTHASASDQEKAANREENASQKFTSEVNQDQIVVKEGEQVIGTVVFSGERSTEQP